MGWGLELSRGLGLGLGLEVGLGLGLRLGSGLAVSSAARPCSRLGLGVASE